MGGEAADLLMTNAAMAAARDGGVANVRAVHAWALVHGLAMLMLDGHVPADAALIDQAISSPLAPC